MQLIKVDETVSSKAKEARNKRIRARNRWHLFATMAMNPSIIRYRIRFLDVNTENSFLSDKLTNMMNMDEKHANGNASPLNLRQRQSKVSDEKQKDNGEVNENYYVMA